jgi:hypothetical protein
MRCGTPLALAAGTGRTHRRQVLNWRMDGVRDAIWRTGGWRMADGGRGGRTGSGDGVGLRRNVAVACTDGMGRSSRILSTPQHLRDDIPSTAQHSTARHGDHKDIGAAAGPSPATGPPVDTAARPASPLHRWLRRPLPPSTVLTTA